MHPSKAIKGIKSKKLKGKKIIYGITGSIAAVESVKIARELIRHGASVKPLMNRDAIKIIHPNAIEFATGEKPIIEITGMTEHLMKADAMLIAPCTANTISKIANGIADDVITTFALSNKKILIAPSMDKKMYENPFLKENIKKCMDNGIKFIKPKIEEGKAKMADIETIVENVIRTIKMNINAKLLIIGGSTMQPIDNVRAITNFSSGKMAKAIAREAYERCKDVEMWCGNMDCPPYINGKNFSTIEDLIKLIKNAEKYDVVINCSAISDFIPEKFNGKISSGKEINLKLKPAIRINPMLRKISGKLIIFKLDDESNVIEKAKKRMAKDKADYVIANTFSSIGSEDTKIWIIGKNMIKEYEGKKDEVAKYIIDLI